MICAEAGVDTGKDHRAISHLVYLSTVSSLMTTSLGRSSIYCTSALCENRHNHIQTHSEQQLTTSDLR